MRDGGGRGTVELREREMTGENIEMDAIHFKNDFLF
jgi:hypothetical protein